MKKFTLAFALAALSSIAYGQVGQVRPSSGEAPGGVQIRGDTTIRPQNHGKTIEVGERKATQKPTQGGTQIQGNTNVDARQRRKTIASGKQPQPLVTEESKKAE